MEGIARSMKVVGYTIKVMVAWQVNADDRQGIVR